MLIGIVGFANSGKGTIGNFLVEDHGFVADSFAGPLKDAAALIFGWDRDLLEGDTNKSRFWREQTDSFWAKALEKDNFTPRKGLQLLGTDGCRNILGTNIWTASFEKRFLSAGSPNTVITDCRFKNEIDVVRNLGGRIINIKRGPNPSWYQEILFYNRGMCDNDDVRKINVMRSCESIPHESETDWIGCIIDNTIHNDGTVNELKDHLADILSEFKGIESQGSFNFEE